MSTTSARVKTLFDQSTLNRDHILKIPSRILDHLYRDQPADERDAIRGAFVTRERTNHLLSVVFGVIFAVLGIAAGLELRDTDNFVTVIMLVIFALGALFAGLREYRQVRHATAIAIRLEQVEARMSWRRR